MNLQQLKILVLIAKHRKLTTVAQILKIKQPTVTFHMKKLEETSGVTLFRNHAKNIFLTDAGKALFHYASRIVSWVEEAEQTIYDYRQLKKGNILIGASNTSATYFIPHSLGQLQETYPNIHISLIVKNTPLALEKLKKFEIDFCIVAENEINDPDLVVYPLLQDELGLVLYPDHPFTKGDKFPLEYLRDERWILREKDSASRRMFEEWAIENEVELKVTMELGATEAIKKTVMSKLGISILSYLTICEEVQNKQLVFKQIPSPILTRNIFLVYNRNQFITPIVQGFIDFYKAKYLKD